MISGLRLPLFEHLQPTSLAEASELLKRFGGEAIPVAGGTDLLVSMKQRIFQPRYLIDLKSIPELHGIRERNGGVEIGSQVTLKELQASPLLQERVPVLVQAASKVGATQHQYMGTIGGNICLDTRCWYYNQSEFWRQAHVPCLKVTGDTCFVVPTQKGEMQCYATYSGDTAPALLVLQAEVQLAGAEGERVAPLRNLFSGDGMRPFTLKPGELLAKVRIPWPVANTVAVYKKFRMREVIDFPLDGVAVLLILGPGRFCREARVALTAVGTRPIEAQRAARALEGKELTLGVVREAAQIAIKEARPVKNVVSTPGHRRTVVGVLFSEAVSEALNMAGCPQLDGEM